MASGVFITIYDVLIYSMTWDDHHKHIKEALAAWKQAELTAECLQGV